jgi:hypothetical protein
MQKISGEALLNPWTIVDNLGNGGDPLDIDPIYGGDMTSDFLPLEEVIYTDYAFRIEQPKFLKSVQENGGSQINYSYFDFNPVYNFYVQSFEREETAR